MPYLMFVGATLLWSTNFIIGKELVELPPIFVAAARFGVAGIAMVPIMIRQGVIPRGPVRRTLLFMGLTGILVYNPLIYLGLHFTSAINTTLVNSLSPLIMGVLGHFWLRERLRPAQLIGLVCSLLGVIWITSRGDPRLLLQLKLNPGDLIILCGTTAFATFTVLTRQATKSVSSIQATMWSSWIGLLFLVPMAGAEQLWAPLPPLTLPMIAAIVFLGLFPTVIAYFLWTTAIARVGSTAAAMFYNLIPAFSALMAVTILGEQFHPYDWVGSGCILAGILVASVRRRRGGAEPRSEPARSV